MTSVGSILGGAFGLVRRHPVSVLIWGLLYMAAIAGLLFAIRPLFAVDADLFSQQLAAGADKPLTPQDLQPYMARFQSAGGILFLSEIGLFAFVMIVFTATQRAVLRPAERGFAYLRIGGDELRLIGLGLFLAVCIYIASILAMLAMMIVVGIAFAITLAATGSPVVGILLLSIALLVLIGATIYAEVRLSLAFPLTFIRRSFVIGEAWQLTKGRFWTLFGAYFVIGLVQMVLATILFIFAFAPLISELAQGGNTPEAIQLAFQHQMERFVVVDARNVTLWLGATLLSGLGIALFGAVATAARDLLVGDPALSKTAGGDGA
jgi:hypothetical protein